MEERVEEAEEVGTLVQLDESLQVHLDPCIVSLLEEGEEVGHEVRTLLQFAE